jgi:uncharacterized membrane protein YjfL (UPF0719 family)
VTSAIYVTVVVVATAGLVYELVAAAAASYLLGDSITQFSTVIGAYLFVYTWITHHDEYELIRRNNPGAAIALGLSMLGFSLPVASAPAQP